MTCLNSRHVKNNLDLKLDNCPILGTEAIKTALEDSFYLKIKNESNRLWYGWNDRTSIQYIALLQHV